MTASSSAQGRPCLLSCITSDTYGFRKCHSILTRFLPSLLVKLIKTGAKVVRHSKYVTFQMAEVAVSRKVFAAILARLRKWAAKARAGPVPAVT